MTRTILALETFAMARKSLPFSNNEYQRRLRLTRAAMAEKNIHTLFVTDPSNMAWLTGYDGWSFYVHQGVFVFMDQEPVWWGRRQDVNGALRTVWMTDERIHGYADHYVQSTDRHPMQDLAMRLYDYGSGPNIGVEMDNYYFSAQAFATLQQAMPDKSFVDATALVNWQRGVKSEEELNFMHKAARISETIIDGLVERIAPGIAKHEIVAEIYRDAIRGVDGAWGDYPAIVPLLPSGSDAAAPHLTWDNRPFATGEATFFEISGCYRRYHAPFCRTIFLGQPPDHLKRAEAALVEGLEAGLEAACAGNRACDIAFALAAPLKKAGIERGARCGYPVGLSYPPDWGERTISLREDDKTVLRAGMTFHFMPGLWMDEWGLEITETILITEDGSAKTLCNRPRKMFVK